MKNAGKKNVPRTTQKNICTIQREREGNAEKEEITSAKDGFEVISGRAGVASQYRQQIRSDYLHFLPNQSCNATINTQTFRNINITNGKYGWREYFEQKRSEERVNADSQMMTNKPVKALQLDKQCQGLVWHGMEKLILGFFLPVPHRKCSTRNGFIFEQLRIPKPFQSPS